MLFAKLASADVRFRPVRFFLGSAAMMLSVALVVAITSGYASLEGAMRSFIEVFIDATDFEITNTQDRRPAVPIALADDLRADGRVRSVHARVEAYVTPMDENDTPLPAASLNLFGIDRATDPIDDKLQLYEGRWFEPGEPNTIVLDENALSLLDKKVGDTIRVPNHVAPVELKIVGGVRQIGLLRGFYRTGYLPVATLQHLTGADAGNLVTKVRGEFHVDVDADAFVGYWQQKLIAQSESLQIRLIREQRSELDRNLRGLKLASYMGSSVSLLAAAFIVFGTVSMGVAERRRQLALLRAVGAGRLLVVKTVLAESALMACVGIVVGIPLGIVLVHVLDLVFPSLFSAGVFVDRLGLLFAAVVTLIAGVGAGIWPAIRASRTSPLEAMQSVANAPAHPLPKLAIAVGLLLVSLDSLIIFAPIGSLLRTIGVEQFEREARFYAHFALGLPTLMLGMLLVAPLIVFFAERAIGPIAAKLAGVRFELLRQQLSGSPWRSAGTAAALMVGLAVLVTMQVQSTSALSSWNLPTRFPDIFILAEGGAGRLNDAEVARIRETPGLDADRVTPVHVVSPRLGDNVFALAGAMLPDMTLFIGLEPERALDMMQLDFRSGDEATAKRMLTSGRKVTLTDGSVLHGTIESQGESSISLRLLDGSNRTVNTGEIKSNEPGRYIIITEEFRKVRGYELGSVFPLEAGVILTRKYDYVVVGVVWSPGLDVMLARFDLSSRVQEQTASTVFGTIADARRDFGSGDAFLVAAYVNDDRPREQLISTMSKELGRTGLYIADVRRLKEEMVETFESVVRMASTIAWAAMAVASLGVTNAVVAGVQARRWTIGVLRAIGLTRGELLRLVLIESMLLGIAGAMLGLAAGLLISTNARGLWAQVVGFEPPVSVPWLALAGAVAAVIALAGVAGIWPATSTSRRTTLELLQSGRSAA